MVVWIFNPFDILPSEGRLQRFGTLARELGREGHQVVWWSATFSHSSKKTRSASVVGDEADFRIRLIECPAYTKNISLKRMRSHRDWANRLLREATNDVSAGLEQRPDLIVASMPPMEGPIAALRLRESFGCRVVTDVMDAWPDTLLQVLPHWAAPVGHLVLNSYYRMLRQALRGSDAVSAQSRSFAEFAKVHGAKSDPYVCCLGAEAISVGSANKPGSHAGRKRRFVYIGSMGPSYDLKTLISAAVSLLKDGAPIELHLAGSGEHVNTLMAIAGEFEGSSIIFHGFLGGEDFDELLSTCHVGIVPMKPASKVAMPYKIGDYLAAGLPVINSLPGELSELLRENDCGSFYTSGDSLELGNAMKSYLEMSDEYLKIQRQAARRLFEEKLNRSRIYPQFVEWLNQVAQPEKIES